MRKPPLFFMWLVLGLMAGCSQPHVETSSKRPGGWYRSYADAADAWSAICHDPAYPFVTGEVVTNALLMRLDEVYVCEGGGCVFPDAADVNQRCQAILEWQHVARTAPTAK